MDRLWRDERGATAVEYGLIVSLIVIAVVSGVSSLGVSVGTRWNDIAGRVAAVTPS